MYKIEQTVSWTAMCWSANIGQCARVSSAGSGGVGPTRGWAINESTITDKTIDEKTICVRTVSDGTICETTIGEWIIISKDAIGEESIGDKTFVFPWSK